MSSEDRYYVINGTLIHADQLEELYHAGRLGMKWGKHLPGTDWWKEATAANLNSLPYQKSNKPGVALTKNTFGNKVRANLMTAKQAAKNYSALAKNTAKAYGASARVTGKRIANTVKNDIYQIKKGRFGQTSIGKGTKRLWNEGKGYTKERISQLKQFAKDAYSKSRESVVNFMRIAKNGKPFDKNTPVTMLQEYQTKQWRDYMAAYNDSKLNGSFANTLNKWFQNAQYGIVKGANKYLQAFGLDDDVDRFMKKFKNSSSNSRSSARNNSRNMTK